MPLQIRIKILQRMKEDQNYRANLKVQLIPDYQTLAMEILSL